MSTITISLADSAEDETVAAEYFQIEAGWITFKTAEHKAVASYPEARVTRIRTDASGPKVSLVLTDPVEASLETLRRTRLAASFLGAP